MGYTMDALYTVEGQKKPNMDHISHAYSLLSNASGLKTRRVNLCEQVVDQVYNLYKVNPVVGSFLKKEALNGVVEIAWKFVTLPIPVVVSQPKKYDKALHNREFGYWDAKLKMPLVYTRPVVYRCYDGQLECKGSVANTNIPEIRTVTITITPHSPATSSDVPDNTAQASFVETQIC